MLMCMTQQQQKATLGKISYTQTYVHTIYQPSTICKNRKATLCHIFAVVCLKLCTIDLGFQNTFRFV